eukprot:5754086-Pleurochrysis_carterae.AAC.1
MIAAANKAEEAAAAELRRVRAPAPHAWEQLSEGEARWARKTDIDFLCAVLGEREWHACDLSTALARAGLLEGVFNSSEMWSLRIEW